MSSTAEFSSFAKSYGSNMFSFFIELAKYLILPQKYTLLVAVRPREKLWPQATFSNGSLAFLIKVGSYLFSVELIPSWPLVFLPQA